MLSELNSWILTVVIFSPLLGALLLWLPPRGDDRAIRRCALFYSLVTLLVTIIATVWFYDTAPRSGREGSGFALTHHVAWLGAFVPEGRTTTTDLDVLTDDFEDSSRIDISYRVGVDGISIWLLVLTSFLSPLVIWSTFTSVKTRLREFYSLLLLLQVGLLGVFCALDLLLFYVFFEFTLVPLYFIIGIWGGPERKRAANKFFIYTLAGSVLTFAGVIYLAYYTYTVSPSGMITLNIVELTQLAREGFISYNVQWWLFLAFAAGFAIKVPLFPLHTWLPLAHTEAPTAGSVVLAGVLLKLGTYGFCRLSIPIFPDAARNFAPLIAVVAIIGIIYAALAAWVQRDVKKLVAYSSVSHLGFCMLGLFSLKIAGVTGGVLYMVNHGLSTGALFLVVGFIYERYHTRDISEIGGLARPMPWMAFFLVFFTLSSIGLPGLNGFVSEFLVLLGTATSRTVTDLRAAGPLGYGYVIPAALGIILGAVYMLWMCQRVLFGPVKEPPNTPDASTGLTPDLTRREIAILAPIAFACVILGVYPKPMLRTFEVATVQHILLSGSSSLMTDADAGAATPPAPKGQRFVATGGAQPTVRWAERNPWSRSSYSGPAPEGRRKGSGRVAHLLSACSPSLFQSRLFQSRAREEAVGLRVRKPLPYGRGSDCPPLHKHPLRDGGADEDGSSGPPRLKPWGTHPGKIIESPTAKAMGHPSRKMLVFKVASAPRGGRRLAKHLRAATAGTGAGRYTDIHGVAGRYTDIHGGAGRYADIVGDSHGR